MAVAVAETAAKHGAGRACAAHVAPAVLRRCKGAPPYRTVQPGTVRSLVDGAEGGGRVGFSGPVHSSTTGPLHKPTASNAAAPEIAFWAGPRGIQSAQKTKPAC